MQKYINLCAIFAFCLFSYNVMLADSLKDLYDKVPDKSTCYEGILKQSEKDKILNEVNKIRAIHKLKPVVYNSTYDINTAKSALLTASNEELNHTPPDNWSCYSKEGYTGSSSSNLYISWTYGDEYTPSVESVYSWINDFNVDVCGHRRWLIDPFLKEISFGRCDFASAQHSGFNVTGASIWVIDDNKQDLSDWNGDFVAYPYENYPPKYFYNQDNNAWYLSFSVVVDKTNFWNNNLVDFSKAKITITDANGAAVTISDQNSNNDYYGLGNALMWKTSDLTQDMVYNVKIIGVVVNNVSKDYSYWFNLTDKALVNTPNAPALSSPANNSVDITTNTTLKWNASDGASSYHLMLSTTSDFSSGNTNVDNITATSYDVKNLSTNTKYYWKVSAKNTSGESSFSDVFVFTTAKGIPAAVTLQYPDNNIIGVSRDTNFVWRKVADADYYTLQVSNNSDFTASSLLIDENNIKDTLYKMPHGLLNLNTRYYWRVSAYNTGGTGGWSGSWFFRTVAADGVDNLQYSAEAKIYPNPAKNKANLSFYIVNSSVVTIEIVNLNGEKVYSEVPQYLGSGEYTRELNFNTFTPGVYFLNLNINGKISTVKFSING